MKIFKKYIFFYSALTWPCILGSTPLGTTVGSLVSLFLNPTLLGVVSI